MKPWGRLKIKCFFLLASLLHGGQFLSLSILTLPNQMFIKTFSSFSVLMSLGNNHSYHCTDSEWRNLELEMSLKNAKKDHEMLEKTKRMGLPQEAQSEGSTWRYQVEKQEDRVNGQCWRGSTRLLYTVEKDTRKMMDEKVRSKIGGVIYTCSGQHC